MNSIYKIVLISLTCSLIFSLTSCVQGFQEINTNENAPIDVRPSLLLRKVLWDYGEQMSYEGFVSGGLLGQYLTAVDFNLFDRHSLSEPQFGGNPWPIFYTNLRDNEIILEKATTNPTFEVYEGPARILKAYMTSALTDIFGDVPYSEALKGKSGIIAPKYDKQEDIYLGDGGIIDNLDKAIMAIDSYTGNIPLEGDIIYGGNLESWKKMANSLKLKALMRISDQVDVAADVKAIYEESNYISTAAENASFDFTDTEPNNFRIATARIGDFNIYVMSKTNEEILKNYNDPRINTFFRTTSGDPSTFNGLLNGPDASQLSISIADYSLAGTIFRERTGDLDANFISSWEVNLLLAEASLKGFIEADTKALYDLAVTQSFKYWQTDLPSDYLETVPSAYDENNALEQIITQKWISNMVNGFEGWIEYKRTGFPALKMVDASLNNDLIPVRMPYPIDEAALNQENYNKAAGDTDNNSINAPVWWDIN